MAGSSLLRLVRSSSPGTSNYGSRCRAMISSDYGDYGDQGDQGDYDGLISWHCLLYKLAWTADVDASKARSDLSLGILGHRL